MFIPIERFCSWTCFETEAEGSSEMAEMKFSGCLQEVVARGGLTVFLINSSWLEKWLKHQANFPLVINIPFCN